MPHDLESSLRPRGTVEVNCSYPGCGTAWWLDPLDPRLPNGPFDCGDNHEARKLVERRLSLLRIRHGIGWGAMSPLGPDGGPTGMKDDGGCRRFDASRAALLVADREGTREGLLTWMSPQDLADVDAVPSKINWDRNTWPAGIEDMLSLRVEVEPPHGDIREDPQPEPDGVRWVGYETGKKVRRYTFIPCSREGCAQLVMVDTEDPTFKPPPGYAVGAWGGGTMAAPPWWGKFWASCENGISSTGRVPCVFARSDALAQFEQASMTRWTLWDYSDRSECGTMLFFDPLCDKYGILSYQSLEAFSTASRIAQGIHWGNLSEVTRFLQSKTTARNRVLEELERHRLHLPS